MQIHVFINISQKMKSRQTFKLRKDIIMIVVTTQIKFQNVPYNTKIIISTNVRIPSWAILISRDLEVWTNCSCESSWSESDIRWHMFNVSGLEISLRDYSCWFICLSYGTSFILVIDTTSISLPICTCMDRSLILYFETIPTMDLHSSSDL